MTFVNKKNGFGLVCIAAIATQSVILHVGLHCVQTVSAINFLFLDTDCQVNLIPVTHSVEKNTSGSITP